MAPVGVRVFGWVHGVYHYVVRPVMRPCIKLLSLLGNYFTLAVRAVYVFIYSLYVFTNWDQGEAHDLWALLSDNSFPRMPVVDVASLVSIVRSPSKWLWNFKRWRRKKTVRWAKPKGRVLEELRRAYGTYAEEQQLLKWKQDQGKGRCDKEVEAVRLIPVANDQGFDDENEQSEGDAEQRHVAVVEQSEEAVKPASIGRKEAKRGPKRRHRKR